MENCQVVCIRKGRKPDMWRIQPRNYETPSFVSYWCINLKLLVEGLKVQGINCKKENISGTTSMKGNIFFSAEVVSKINYLMI